MSPTPTILHLIGHLGWVDHAEQLRLLALAQTEAGLRAQVVAFAGERQDCQSLANQGIHCRIVRRRWSRDPFTAHQLSQLAGRLQPQVIHCWGNETAEFAAILRWAVPAARIVATLEEPLTDRLFWIPGSREAVNVAVTDSPEFAGHASHDVRFVAPGVPVISSDCSRAELLDQWELPADAKLLVTACRLERSQRLDEALWNYELVRTLEPRACYLIVGEGPERAHLERYCRLVTNPATVRFLHPRDWYPAAITQADVYWQPGVCRVIPTGLLHALAQGIPTIAHEHATLQGVIASGDNGLLVPTGSRSVATRHSVRLLTDSAAADALEEAGRRTASQRFSAEQLVATYQQLSGLPPQTTAA